MKSSLNNNALNHGELRTVPQLSKLFRLSQKQIRDYIAEGAPVAIPGKRPTPHQINTADFFHWCIAKRDADNRLRKRAPADEFKERAQRATAELKELELERARTNFVRLEHVGALLDEAFVEARVLVTQAVKEKGNVELERMLIEVLKLVCEKTKAREAELEIVS